MSRDLLDKTAEAGFRIAQNADDFDRKSKASVGD